MEDNIETLAKQRVQARMGFIVHALIFVACNAGLFGIWTATGQGYPWFLWPMLMWGIGMIGHAVSLVVGPGSAREQRAIAREVQRLRMATR